MMNMTPAVKQLLIINILFYIGSNIVGPAAYTVLAEFFPENPNFNFWQPLTSMFMHAPVMGGIGITHILFNMIALVSFGSLLENMWGAKKFLFFYISAGLGAIALHIAINYLLFNEGLQALVDNGLTKQQVLMAFDTRNFTAFEGKIEIPDFEKMASAYYGTAVGASGAIYGLLVAFAMLAPNAELMLMFIPVPIKAKYFVPGLLAVDLYLGITGKSIFGSGGGVAHFAHIGGAIVGFIMMWYWKKNSFNNKRWD